MDDAVDPTPTTRSFGCIMQRTQFLPLFFTFTIYVYFPAPDGFNELRAFSHVFLACLKNKNTYKMQKEKEKGNHKTRPLQKCKGAAGADSDDRALFFFGFGFGFRLALGLGLGLGFDLGLGSFTPGMND